MSIAKKKRVFKTRAKRILSYTMINMDYESYIDFHSKALKYLLFVRDWDSASPNTGFEHDPRVSRYKEAFDEFTKNHMYKDTILNQQLKSFVGYRIGLEKESLKKRQRKYRITRLWKESTKFLKRKCIGVIKPDQGLTVFTIKVKRHFLK